MVVATANPICILKTPPLPPKAARGRSAKKPIPKPTMKFNRIFNTIIMTGVFSKITS